MSESSSDDFYDPVEAAKLLAAGGDLLKVMRRHNKYCARGGTCSITTISPVVDAILLPLKLTEEYRRKKLKPGAEAGGYILMGILGKRVPDSIILTARAIEDASDDLNMLMTAVVPQMLGGQLLHQRPPEGARARFKTAGALKLALDELRTFLGTDNRAKRTKTTEKKRRGAPTKKETKQRAAFAKPLVAEGLTWPEIFERYTKTAKGKADKKATADTIRLAYNREYPPV
jgi:hypothetical protein